MKKLFFIYAFLFVGSICASESSSSTSSGFAGNINYICNIDRLEAELQEALQNPSLELTERAITANLDQDASLKIKMAINPAYQHVTPENKEQEKLKLSTYIIEQETDKLNFLLHQKNTADLQKQFHTIQSWKLPIMKSHLLAHAFCRSLNLASQNKEYEEYPDHALSLMKPEDAQIPTYDNEWPLIKAIKDWVKKSKTNAQESVLKKAQKRVDKLFELNAPCHAGRCENALLAAYDEPKFIFPYVLQKSQQQDPTAAQIALITTDISGESIAKKLLANPERLQQLKETAKHLNKQTEDKK